MRQNQNLFGDFRPGEELLYTNGNGGLGLSGTHHPADGLGPLEVSFTNGIDGLWLQVQNSSIGDQEFELALFYNNSTVATFSRSGISGQNADGSALSLGFVSTMGEQIDGVRISSSSSGVANNNFVFGAISFSNSVPEPSSFSILLPLLGIAWLRRRRILS